MISLPTISLLAAMTMATQGPDEMPEAWKQKYEAADRALESGALARAELLMLEVIGDAEKLGAQDLRLATPLENLAVFYIVRKRYDEAEPLLRRALAIREKIQGPNDPHVAETLIDLAKCDFGRGEERADNALPRIRRAIAIIERSKGKDSPEIGGALQALGMWHLLRKELDQAEPILLRVLAIRERAFGPSDPRVASVLDDLGDIHAPQSEASVREEIEAERNGQPGEETRAGQHGRKAEAFYQRALAIREKALKPDDPHIAETVYNLGQLAFIRRRPAEVERYLGRWLKMQEAARAPATEKQATVLMMLGTAAMDGKAWAEAERRMAKMQTILAELHGPESVEVSMALEARAMAALEAGRFDDAEQHLERGLDLQAARLGPQDPDVVQARSLLAGSYRDHVDDRRAPLLWHRLTVLGREAGRGRKRDQLGEILTSYAELLRRTNRIVPRPTEEDLAYLKRAGGVLPFVDLDDLAREDGVLDYALDDAGLKHIARMYEIERLHLHGDQKRITDAGLGHIRGLVNLKHLNLSTTGINDAGLAQLAGLESLEELILMSTRVIDAGLIHLKGLKRLRELDLAFTDITDAGLKHLEGFKSLPSLSLKYTKASESAVQALRRARPDLTIEYEPGPGFFRPAVPPEGVPGVAPIPGGLPAVPPAEVPPVRHAPASLTAPSGAAARP